MSDDLITTAAVAKLLGKSVATINRWAADERQDRPQPALTLPGDTGARLYRRTDVEAYKATEDARLARAIERGACERCTLEDGIPTFHNPCPNTEAVAS